MHLSKDAFLSITVMLGVIVYSAVVLTDNASYCGEKRSAIQQQIDEPVACNTQADCIVTTLACPFTCQAAFDTEKIKLIRNQMQEYYVSCMPCEQPCDTTPKTALCQMGVCKLSNTADPSFKH